MSTLTVPAPKIEIGDRIDGRTVRVVTGLARSVERRSPARPTTAPKPELRVGHVVCVRLRGRRAVEVPLLL
jgi:hypothetical protein